MPLPIIVCPANPPLLRRLAGRTLAPRVKRVDQAAAAAAQVTEAGASLFCVIVHAAQPMAALEFPQALKDVPLAIMAPTMGRFRDLAQRLGSLRGFNLRVFLPCDKPENFVALRVLSSLGIPSGAVFGADTDWDDLADLMTYAVLGRVPHAPMDPFSYIVSRYQPASYLNWGASIFDDPTRFLHLDGKGRVALSEAELRRRCFVADSLDGIAEADDLPAIGDRAQAWRGFFAENHPCTACPGWKLCLARFATGPAAPDRGCAAFFEEMIEVALRAQALTVARPEHRTWQA